MFRKASQKGPSTNRIPERERKYAHELREVPQHRDTKPRVSGGRTRDALWVGQGPCSPLVSTTSFLRNEGWGSWVEDGGRKHLSVLTRRRGRQNSTGKEVL